MPAYVQAERPLAIHTPLGPDALLLTGLSGSEAISRLFRFDLNLIAENARTIPFERLLGQKIAVRLALHEGGYRHLHGICTRVAQGERDSTFTSYHMEIAPAFWFLTRKAQSRIFQHLTVPEILKQVLAGLDVRYELQGEFLPRDFCVQYRETDFAFASRLMEEEGIAYFFTHNASGHTMVLANTPQGHPELEGGAVKFIGGEESNRLENRVATWEKTQELRSGKYTLWDHTFELPHKHLENSQPIQASSKVGTVEHPIKIGNHERLEIYDYPGEYASRFDGVDKGRGDRPADVQNVFKDNKRTTSIRMQEEAAHSIRIRGESDIRRFTTGHRFTLAGHYNADGKYLLVSARHEARLNSNYRSGNTDEFVYSNHYECIPADIPYRPERITPIPTVQGTQTAVVVGPAGEEIYTDKYGRIKVQFHWDREGKSDVDSSCWVRVAQNWAGRRWGAFFWPRVGQEVIVAFEEGNPNRPIVVGSVYNADQMPPYLGKGPDGKHPDDNKVSGIKSNSTLGGSGFNEFRFDDTRGKEQVFIHSERNMDVRVKNDSMERVIHDRHLIVGNGSQGNQRELVHKDKHLHVKGDQEEKIEGAAALAIGKNLEIRIAGDKHETIQGNRDQHISKDRREKVDGNQSLTVGQSRQEKIGMKHAVEAGQEIHIKSGMTLVLEAGVQLTLKVGGNFIDINPTGIAIQGTMVLINSGGAPGSGTGSSPAAPTDAREAKPIDPTEADNAVSGQKSN